MQAAALVLAITREADGRSREAAFDEVVRRSEARILRIAYRILGSWADAEDVAQDVFIRLHRHGLSFPDDGSLNSWLYRVTVNRAIDRSRSVRPQDALTEVSSHDPSAETELLRTEQKRLLMAALGTLPPKERAAVVLREIEGISTADVAAALGSSEETVRSQVSRAIARLRKLLNKEGK
jgi:RNA polymerase sigma-70 factor (ECF subfamily)